jgi:hypothetical protein
MKRVKLTDKAKGLKALFILKNAKVLPLNAKQLYRDIRKAGM